MDTILTLPDQFVCFDTEYTTWEGAQERHWSGPGEYREIVQIGAVLVRGDTLTEEGSFGCLVRPTKNPKLSAYFSNLTGVSQQAVDENGVSYSDALVRFASFASTSLLYCWGMDLEIMASNAKLVGLPFPFPLQHKRDVRSLFEVEGIATSTYCSSTIPRAFNEEPPPSAHDALNDARSILQGLRALKRRLEQ